jgi:hypothetical protein
LHGDSDIARKGTQIEEGKTHIEKRIKRVCVGLESTEREMVKKGSRLGDYHILHRRMTKVRSNRTSCGGSPTFSLFAIRANTGRRYGGAKEEARRV